MYKLLHCLYDWCFDVRQDARGLMEFKEVFHKILIPWLMNLQLLVKGAIIKRMTGVMIGDMISKPYLLSFILLVKHKAYIHMSIFVRIIYVCKRISVMPIAKILPT